MQSTLNFLKTATDLLIGPSSKYSITIVNKNGMTQLDIGVDNIAPIKFFNRTVVWLGGMTALNLALGILAKTSIGVAIGIPVLVTAISTSPLTVIIISGLAMSLLSTLLIEKYGSRPHRNEPIHIIDRRLFTLSNCGL